MGGGGGKKRWGGEIEDEWDVGMKRIGKGAGRA